MPPVKRDPRIAYIPDIHGHAKGEHKAFAEERPIPYTARMLFLWFFHACRRSSPRFLMVADHMNYLTFEDPAAVNLVRRALKLAQAGDLYGAAETAGVELGHAAVVSEGLKRGMRYSIGAEIDNDPRCRPDAQNIVDAMKPDGMIRSIHFLPITHPQHGENWMWAFDNPEFADLYDVVGTETVWEIYMATLLDAIEKLPGNIVGHFYVPAKFGHWPADDVLEGYEDRFVAACAERGMAIELNARYFYKYYLADDAQLARYKAAHLRLLRKAKAASVMVAVGSDAHSPKDQGNAFETVLEVLDEAEINEIAFPIAGRLARVALRATEDVLRQHSAALAPPVIERPSAVASATVATASESPLADESAELADVDADADADAGEALEADGARVPDEVGVASVAPATASAAKPRRSRAKTHDGDQPSPSAVDLEAARAQADTHDLAAMPASAATTHAEVLPSAEASAHVEMPSAPDAISARDASPEPAPAVAPATALAPKKRSHKKSVPAITGLLADAVTTVATQAVEAVAHALKSDPEASRTADPASVPPNGTDAGPHADSVTPVSAAEPAALSPDARPEFENARPAARATRTKPAVKSAASSPAVPAETLVTAVVKMAAKATAERAGKAAATLGSLVKSVAPRPETPKAPAKKKAASTALPARKSAASATKTRGKVAPTATSAKKSAAKPAPRAAASAKKTKPKPPARSAKAPAKRAAPVKKVAAKSAKRTATAASPKASGGKRAPAKTPVAKKGSAKKTAAKKKSPRARR